MKLLDTVWEGQFRARHLASAQASLNSLAYLSGLPRSTYREPIGGHTLAASFAQSDLDDPLSMSKKLDDAGGLTAGVTASATEGGVPISIGETRSLPNYIKLLVDSPKSEEG